MKPIRCPDAGFAPAIGVLLVVTAVGPAGGQAPPGRQGSSNVRVAAHVPLGHAFTVADVEIEQERSRPFAYVSRMHGATKQAGFAAIDLSDIERPEVIYRWRIDEPELHVGYGGVDGKYAKVSGRYYYVQAFQFLQGGPDADLGAIVFDVTGLPDPMAVREVARIRAPRSAIGAMPGGFHNVFAYKHSDGRALLFTTTLSGTYANIHDMERLVSGAADLGAVGRVGVPGATGRYHDFYVAYDPAARQDKFYGGAQPGGYFIIDVTRPEEPSLITSVTVGYPAIQSAFGRGHTATPTPDGRYLVTETEYQYAPLRIFDLKPGLDGEVESVTRPIGAWTARWKGLPHNHEIRWPYVFVSAYEDGLQIFNIMDPSNPYTVGYYDTYDGPHRAGIGAAGQYEPTIGPEGSGGVLSGAWGVDIRNADGLIVVGDMVTGLWAIELDGFDGWNGQDWGVPNVSSAQDWDAGPNEAATGQRLSQRALKNATKGGSR